MKVEEFLKTLKTAKRVCPSSSTTLESSINSSYTPFNTLINNTFSSSSSTTTTQSTNTLESFLSSLTSHQLQSFLSDPTVKTFDCFRIFNLVLHSQSSLSFKPGFHPHFTLLCRLIKSRFFQNAEFLLHKLILDPNYRYPFTEFVHHIEKYCNESKIITKMLNMLLKKYSDNGLFDMASTVFDYMLEKAVEPDERTCSVLLHAMVKADKTDLAFEFFHRMVNSSMKVSVYSLTIVVNGLCKIGELKMGRELVEEMSKKGIKPNIVTFNALVDASVRRLDLEELKLVLRLMEEEGIQFDDSTYKLLIEGYTASGNVEEAEKFLLEMHDKDVEVEGYLYITVIRGYCRLGRARSGLSLFRKLKEWKLLTNGDIYRSLISCSCRVGEMGQVKELLFEMCSNGHVLDDDLLNTIDDGYRKAGMLDELAELQCMLKMNGSPFLQSSIDADSKVEMVITDVPKLEMIVDDVKNGTAEEMVVDDVLKAYQSP
ncbi:uncharacterized protein LOC141611676 isoform X1 [Silene latifolia]|uniref:uncharacterized protein LOC141611676 isoform X1 n=1 Tax=Silene latifolia TaxID=37657 RepID=UPI003D7820DA